MKLYIIHDKTILYYPIIIRLYCKLHLELYEKILI